MIEDDVYTFIMKQSNGTTITVSGYKANLGEIIQDFEQWLLGCTFAETTVNSYLHHENCHSYTDEKGLKITKCLNEVK